MALTQTEVDDKIIFIIERKTGVDEKIFVSKLVELLFREGCSVKTISVPSPYFVGSGNGFVGKFIARRRLKREVKKIFHFDKAAIYLGPRTSTLMQCAPVNNRVFYDHGLGEYFQEVEYATEELSIKRRLRRYIARTIFELLDIPHFIETEIFNRKQRSYRMCKIIGSKDNFIDYRDSVRFKSGNKFLERHIVESQGVRPTLLFLAVSEYHSKKKGLPTEVMEYDDINYEIILRHASPGESVLIKYHPSLYASLHEVKSNLIDMLALKGIKALIFDNSLPPEYRGIFPAEMIVHALGIRKVLCEESATVFNLAHDNNLTLICDIQRCYKVDANFTDKIIDGILKVNSALVKPVHVFLGQ